jgi:hypothetical protein
MLMLLLTTANRKFAEHAAGSRGSGVDVANSVTSRIMLAFLAECVTQ